MNCGATIAGGTVTGTPWLFEPAQAGGTFPAITLASGQLDVEPWADNQEVVIDRIVGQLNVRYSTFQTVDESPDVVLAPAIYMRLGLIVQEEGDATSAPVIDLFSDEHLEDFEWMWLWSGTGQDWNYTAVSDATITAGQAGQFSIPLDLRVKRKLGQTDSLLLYAQYAIQTSGSDINSGAAVGGDHILRAIFMSK